MPHPIELSDSTFEKLQRLAVPFVDTPESVISRLADEAIAQSGDRAHPATLARDEAPALRLDPDSPGSLTHTRLISAEVGGRDLHRPKWNNLLDRVHVVAREQLGSFESLRRVSNAHLRPGRYEEDGFRYLPEADLSIQGVDANLAWSHSLGVARHVKINLRVKLEWRNKDGAARPGQVAVVEWYPASLAIA